MPFSKEGVPAVSVLVPAFNAAMYVDAALSSVQEQTCTDWEVIAVDDASSDATFDRLVAWQARDPRVVAVRNEHNLGMTANWNACLARARGTFVVKLDADDVMRPEALRVLLASITEPKVIAAAVRALLCDANLEPTGAMPGDFALLQGAIDPYEDHRLATRLWMKVASLGHQLWHSDAMMVRREWLLSSGGFDARLSCASDTDLQLRVLREDGLVAHNAYVGCYYRQLRESVSHIYRKNQWLEWEGLAVALRNLDLLERRERLDPLQRRYRATLWRRWRLRLASQAYGKLPLDMRQRLEGILAGARVPSLLDRGKQRLRDLAASAGI